jgi:hypothetical protein
VQQYANPAREILHEVGLGEQPDFNQPLSDATICEMLKRMRQHLGEQAGAFADEDLLDGITESGRTLVAWSVEVPKLRARLAVFANECCTDDDLKSAVRQPNQPLWLRHACRIQVIESSRDFLQEPTPIGCGSQIQHSLTRLNASGEAAGLQLAT